MTRVACFFVACLTAAAVAQPVAPVNPEQTFIAEHLAVLQQALSQPNLLPERTLAEVVRLTLHDGEMKLELLARDVVDEGVIPLKGVKGVCEVRRLGGVAAAPGAMTVNARILDVDNARAMEISLSSVAILRFDITILNASNLAITTQLSAPAASPFDVEGSEPRFHVQVIDEAGSASTPAIQRSAETVAMLIDENHEQLLESAGEAFRALRAMHLLSGMSEQDVKQMFAANAPAGPEVEKQLATAIEAMRADPQAGEKTLAAVLKAEGPAAASLLSRMPRDGWSADLTLRVDTVLTPFLLQDSGAASNVNMQPHRLIDLLYWSDAGIRRAALERIEALAKVKVDVIADADPYDQFDKIEELRTQLTPANSPLR